MSPVLTATPETGIAPPKKPSRWLVGWATFLGYVLAGLALVLCAFIVVPLVGFSNDEGRGLFQVYNGWSWAAEACVGVLVTAATAWAVAGQIRTKTGWEVPFGFTFLTLLVTGYAPALALTPLFWAASPVSLVLATWILHWRCEPAGAEPMKTLGRVPRRYRRGVAIGLAVAVPLMVGYVLFYAAMHPLGVEVARGAKVVKHEPGKLLRYELLLNNNGTAEVTDIALVRLEGSPVLQLERAETGARVWLPPVRPLRPLDRVTLGDQEFGEAIQLELRQGRFCPEPRATLDAVWLEYTVRGMRHQQRLPLPDAPVVRCDQPSGR